MSSSSEDDNDAPRQALPLPFATGLPTPHGTATTAEQYLAQVHAEAKSLPKVLQAAPLPKPSQSKHATSTPNPSHTARKSETGVEPSPFWQQSVCTFYARLQDTLAERRPPDTRGPCGKDKAIPQLHAEWQVHFMTYRPSLAFLQRLDFVTLVHALTALDDAIASDAPEEARECFVHSALAEWAFSMLAFVQLPLLADVAAIIRSLWTKAVSARTTVGCDDAEALASLNVIITITGDYFGQKDIR